MSERLCCYMDIEGKPCPAPAEWEINSGPTAADVMEACELHVWALITDAREHQINSIGGKYQTGFTLVRDRSVYEP